MEVRSRPTLPPRFDPRVAPSPSLHSAITNTSTNTSALSRDLAEESVWEQYVGHVVAFKGLQVSDYGGRTLSTNRNYRPEFQPDVPEAAPLSKWSGCGRYPPSPHMTQSLSPVHSQNSVVTTPHPQSTTFCAHITTKRAQQPRISPHRWAREGKNAKTVSISTDNKQGMAAFPDRKSIAQMREERLGFGEKSDFVTAKVDITMIKRDDPSRMAYPACPNDDCKKKLTQLTEGWSCEKCGKTYPSPTYRYTLSCTLADHSGSTWATIFNNEALDLLHNRTAEEILQLHDTNEAAFDETFRSVQFQPYLCSFRVKSEMVSDEERLKVTVSRIQPVDFVAESTNLVEAINGFG